jgi:hypothetical protein
MFLPIHDRFSIAFNADAPGNVTGGRIDVTNRERVLNAVLIYFPMTLFQRT